MPALAQIAHASGLKLNTSDMSGGAKSALGLGTVGSRGSGSADGSAAPAAHCRVANSVGQAIAGVLNGS